MPRSEVLEEIFIEVSPRDFIFLPAYDLPDIANIPQILHEFFEILLVEWFKLYDCLSVVVIDLVQVCEDNVVDNTALKVFLNLLTSRNIAQSNARAVCSVHRFEFNRHRASGTLSNDVVHPAAIFQPYFWGPPQANVIKYDFENF